jgi:integrase
MSTRRGSGLVDAIRNFTREAGRPVTVDDMEAAARAAGVNCDRRSLARRLNESNRPAWLRRISASQYEYVQPPAPPANASELVRQVYADIGPASCDAAVNECLARGVVVTHAQVTNAALGLARLGFLERIAPGVYRRTDKQARPPASASPRNRTPRPARHRARVSEPREPRPIYTSADIGEPLRSMLAHFTQEQRDLRRSPATIRTYRSMIIPALAGLSSPDDLTPDNLRAALRRRADDGLRPRSVHLTRGVLAVFCSFLIERGALAPPNPADSVRAPKLDKLAYRALSKPQAIAVLDAAREYREGMFEHAVQLLLATGMRRAELCGLTWDDVDLDVGAVAIRGKGDKPRRVALEAGVINGLRERRATLPRPVPWTTNHVARAVADIGEDAGIPWRLSPHDFRRTFASLWMANGGDVATLQAILGHAQVAMTIHYTRGSIEDTAMAKQRELGILGRLSTPALTSADADDDLAEILALAADPRMRRRLLAMVRLLTGDTDDGAEAPEWLRDDAPQTPEPVHA